MFAHGWLRGSYTITSPDAEPQLQAGHQLHRKLGMKGLMPFITEGLMCAFTSTALGCRQGQEGAKL